MRLGEKCQWIFSESEFLKGRWWVGLFVVHCEIDGNDASSLWECWMRSPVSESVIGLCQIDLVGISLMKGHFTRVASSITKTTNSFTKEISSWKSSLTKWRDALSQRKHYFAHCQIFSSLSWQNTTERIKHIWLVKGEVSCDVFSSFLCVSSSVCRLSEPIQMTSNEEK